MDLVFLFFLAFYELPPNQPWRLASILLPWLKYKRVQTKEPVGEERQSDDRNGPLWYDRKTEMGLFLSPTKEADLWNDRKTEMEPLLEMGMQLEMDWRQRQQKRTKGQWGGPTPESPNRTGISEVNRTSLSLLFLNEWEKWQQNNRIMMVSRGQPAHECSGLFLAERSFVWNSCGCTLPLHRVERFGTTTHCNDEVRTRDDGLPTT